jgi:predicted membrane channel-forming protein YqfA (hemolysin III family)
MKTRTAIIIFSCIVLVFAIPVYFMNDPTAKSEAIWWLVIGVCVFLLGLIIHFVRKKMGSL